MLGQVGPVRIGEDAWLDPFDGIAPAVLVGDDFVQPAFGGGVESLLVAPGGHGVLLGAGDAPVAVFDAERGAPDRDACGQLWGDGVQGACPDRDSGRSPVHGLLLDLCGQFAHAGVPGAEVVADRRGQLTGDGDHPGQGAAIEVASDAPVQHGRDVVSAVEFAFVDRFFELAQGLGGRSVFDGEKCELLAQRGPGFPLGQSGQQFF
ncbi:Uncharacterised protein [Mycobacteroides abscessus subsp. abscessus]|nr:Uncharacterised protein [Mycobacteroides abscessus subsp. abscessus]